MASIPHAAEEFYAPNLSTITPDASRYWVGDAPRLGAPDGSTAYARIEYDTPTFFHVGVQLVPFTLTGGATVSLQARTRGGTAGDYAVEVWLHDINDSVEPVYMYPVLTESDEWQTISTTLAAGDISHLAGVAAAGELVVLTIGFGSIPVDGFDVSWMDFSTGAIPTRVYPRADGLGMGAPRLMDNRSPYRSARVFGMI